jgi:hypothetical protein
MSARPPAPETSGLRGVVQLRLVRRQRLAPKLREVHLYRVKRLGANFLAFLVRANDHPGARLEPQHLQGLENRVDQPSVTDLVSSVDRQLPHAIVPLGGGRQDLADPVGSNLERPLFGSDEAFLSPAGQIGDQSLGSENDPWLAQKNPASRSTNPTAERSAERDGELEGGPGMRHIGPGVDVKLAVDDLADHILREIVEIEKRRWTPDRNFRSQDGHSPILASRKPQRKIFFPLSRDAADFAGRIGRSPSILLFPAGRHCP